MFERWKKRPGSSKHAEPPRPAPRAPFEFLTVPGARAADEMTRASTRAGIVPVLMGDRREFDQVVEQMATHEDDFASIRNAGLALDIEAWMKAQREAEPDCYTLDGPEVFGSGSEATPLTPARELLTGEFRKEVFIGLVPVEEPWLVPAYLKPGGWNDCPPPDVHLAFFHRWHQRHGAVVTTVTNDIVEFVVSRPPQSVEDSFVLAREQFMYCSDIVHQGVGSLGNLAATLKGSSYWYFWWD